MTSLLDLRSRPVPRSDPRTVLRRRVTLFGVAAVAVAICVGSVVLAGFHAPLSYDEAYNAQVPLHLASQGRYATDGALYGGRRTGVVQGPDGVLVELVQA